MSTHKREHCEFPRVTRAWRKLGVGAMWMCDCGKTYRLAEIAQYVDAPYLEWTERPT